ncbi:hypothetical protein F4779DRAFT_640198 [Xylariaceae sp. FL0662B]|nr:hypothetical protein F4779DRAFT_640198 [Xylariaceae sp. FL0662B]
MPFQATLKSPSMNEWQPNETADGMEDSVFEDTRQVDEARVRPSKLKEMSCYQGYRAMSAGRSWRRLDRHGASPMMKCWWPTIPSVLKIGSRIAVSDSPPGRGYWAEARRMSVSAKLRQRQPSLPFFIPSFGREQDLAAAIQTRQKLRPETTWDPTAPCLSRLTSCLPARDQLPTSLADQFENYKEAVVLSALSFWLDKVLALCLASRSLPVRRRSRLDTSLLATFTCASSRMNPFPTNSSPPLLTMKKQGHTGATMPSMAPLGWLAVWSGGWDA